MNKKGELTHLAKQKSRGYGDKGRRTCICHMW